VTHEHTFAGYDVCYDAHVCHCGAHKDRFGAITEPTEAPGCPTIDERVSGGPVAPPVFDAEAFTREVLARADEAELVFDGARLAEAKAAIWRTVQGAPFDTLDRVADLLRHAVRVRAVRDTGAPRNGAAGYVLGRMWLIDQPTTEIPVRSGRELLTC